MASVSRFCTFILVTMTINGSVGSPAKKRYLLYNPADLSTVLGYQNHQVHDLSSLVNEASAHAQGTGSLLAGASSGPYNIPNFPAMGNNQIQPQTGSSGTAMTGSGSSVSGGSTSTGTSGSGSASSPGTNHWRCDSHIVATCDTQCLDVDPKDGCAFCIPGCHAASQTSSGSQPSSSSTGSQSGSSVQSPFAINGQSAGSIQGNGTSTAASSQSGNIAQSPGTLTGGTGQSGSSIQSPFAINGQSAGSIQSNGTNTAASSQSGNIAQSLGILTGGTSQSGSLSQQPGTLSGSGSQSNGGLGGNLVQQTSGLAGTGGNTQAGKTVTSAPVATSTGSTPGGVVCPRYPPNCPRAYTVLDQNGCLICTILSLIKQTTAMTSSTTQPTTAMASSTTQQAAIRTCAPMRCVAPCNVGIVLDSQGCPRCKCPSHV